MKSKKTFRKVLSFLLISCMIFTMVLPASAAKDNGLDFEQVDNSEVTGSLITGEKVPAEDSTEEYKASDTVRVSIMLSDASVVDAGYDTKDIVDNANAMSYLTKTKNNQKNAQKKIEKKLGKKINVKRNLALVANIISAEVKYGDIDKIETVDGVQSVVIETKYDPAATTNSADDPDMAIASGLMTGAQQAWAEGYTGAGARIAIIDTGLDIDHQSFDNDAYLYALGQDAKAAGKKEKNYVKQLKLLSSKEIKKALPYLNAYAAMGGKLTADDLTVSDKIPYAFNYVDSNTNVRHIYDNQGEHGSHVAGIAAANRYLKTENGYEDALEAVGVAGDAPDAQVLVMKVFGQGGGAYDSDYMAAIEDAILLGCDAVNLSLGSGNAGMTTSDTYQELLDKLTSTDTVVVMSAGNSSAWADETYYGYLYDDGVNFATTGSPGTYTNSLSVASVDNLGSYGYSITVDGVDYGYDENLGYGNEKLISLIENGEAETFDYVFIDGMGNPEDFEGIDVEGKVVFIKRGEISFYVKANNAAAKGAIAIIIYNNQAGTISMNLTGYEYTAPCVSITQEDAESIKAASTPVDNYYTGSITISAQAGAHIVDPGYKTMSSFSSWGVPGNLTIKPEISAPGGAIYSVYGTNDAGGGTTEYELMSGTSMAAPQITGMAAVLKRYIETNFTRSLKLTDRALAQSLLMSTATPMWDSEGYYYSVLQQGSGLANVSDAMNADSYIVMGSDATESYKDGKVKAELGDDPEKTGVYTFSFTMYNMTAKKVTYNLDADIFNQYAYKGFLLGDTDFLDADVTFTVNRKSVKSVTMLPLGKTTVKVTVKLTAETKAYLDENYPAGSYVEGYVYAYPTNDSSVHSIPVLAYYGNYTDPSMYDVGSYIEYAYGLEERPPYLYEINGLKGNAYTIGFGDGSGEYYFGGNLYANEEEYHPEFASMNNENGDVIKNINYALIRNAALVATLVTDAKTGEVYSQKVLGSQYAAYYYANGAAWRATSSRTTLNWAGTDASGNPLPEGTEVTVSLVAAPEYYVKADGSVDISELGEGAFFSTSLTIDNTAPVLNAVADGESGSLVIEASDNLGIAAVMLYAEGGKELIGRAAVGASEISTTLGEGLDADVYLVVVVDYAGNMSTYRVFMNMEPTETVEQIVLSDESLVLMKNNTAALTASIEPVNVSDDTVIWTTTDASVATVDEKGVVTGVGEGECEIVAAAAIDPEKTASCTVSVISIDTNLNGVVWDENGKVWFSEFNTANLPEYTKLSEESCDASVNALAYGADGTLYATDIDTEDGISSLYIVDPSTFALTKVGTSDIAYTELAEAPSLGALMAAYFNYLVLVDPETGAYIGAFEYLEEGTNIVGVTYLGSQYNSYYETYLDIYYLLDDAGNLYFEAFIELAGKYYYFNGAEEANLGSTGITCDTPYFQSLYFNGEYTFASCFNETTNRVDLYAIDTEDTGEVYLLGSFADSVWPVGGICELGSSEAETDNGAAFANAKVKEAASTEAIAVRKMVVNK